MITGLRVSRQSIVLEKTELTAVQRHVGGIIGDRGDAGQSLSWLCLHGIGAQGGWARWLMSGEIDAGTVGGFRWQHVEGTARLDTRGQTLPEGQGAIELPVALRRGIAEAEGLRILGQPSGRLGNTLLYLHEHESTIKNQLFTAMSTLAVLLRGGVVSAIEVCKSTTS